MTSGDFRGPTHNSMIGFVIVMVALFAITGLLVLVWSKVSDDEYKTCKIQQQGLPAVKDLVSVVGDIHAILTFPPSPQQKKDLAAIPLKQRAHELRVVADLNHSAADFFAREAKQPRSRTC